MHKCLYIWVNPLVSLFGKTLERGDNLYFEKVFRYGLARYGGQVICYKRRRACSLYPIDRETQKNTPHLKMRGLLKSKTMRIEYKYFLHIYCLHAFLKSINIKQEEEQTPPTIPRDLSHASAAR